MKRPNGDGSIRCRPDGRWEGRIVIGFKSDGTPMVKSIYAKTQRELLRKLHNDIDSYRDVRLTEESRMTLGEWLDTWLETYVRPTSRPATYLNYMKMVDLYIKPVLGEKSVYLITQMDVQKMYHKLKNEGRVREHPELGHQLSDTVINSVHCVFHLAMKCAVQEHIIAHNPVDGAIAPRPKYQKKKILNEAQLKRFMAEIEKDPIWYDFFYTEITTGMRRGEICALRWADFDPKRGTLNVQHSLSRDGDGNYSLGETKTYAGKRLIYLPESTVEVLKNRKKTAYGSWIFPYPLAPEYPMKPDTAYRRLKEILATAELPSIRFHDLRHTFATHALSSGVDAKALSGILGHTNASFTLDTYTHVTTDMHKNAAAVVTNVLQGLFGEELKPWVENEKMAKGQS